MAKFVPCLSPMQPWSTEDLKEFLRSWWNTQIEAELLFSAVSLVALHGRPPCVAISRVHGAYPGKWVVTIERSFLLTSALFLLKVMSVSLAFRALIL